MPKPRRTLDDLTADWPPPGWDAPARRREAQRNKTKRQRRWRQRQRHGIRVLQVPIREFDLISALIEAGRISTAEALDPGALSREASVLLGEWSRRWLK